MVRENKRHLAQLIFNKQDYINIDDILRNNWNDTDFVPQYDYERKGRKNFTDSVIYAVSYRHLDVYKRQIICIS